MADSFGGVDIVILGDPDVQRPASSVTTEQHIPWGNVNYIWLGGKTMPHVTLTVRWLSTADFLTFEALVGTSGTLVYCDGTYTAILNSTTRKNHGVLSDSMEQECDFTLVSSP